MYTLLSDSQIAAFFADVAHNVSALRRMFVAAGLGDGVLPALSQWLPRLPVTSKADLSRLQQKQPPFGGWVPAELEGVRRVFVSPGPIYNVEGEGPDDWGGTEAFRAAGFGPGDLVLNTFTYHLSPASFIAEEALAALGASVLPAGTVPRHQQVLLLADLPITGFVGLPSYLRAILGAVQEEAEAGGAAQATVPLRRAWFTAEGLAEEFRQQLAAEWGISGRQGYGTAELGIVAYECEHADGQHVSAHVIVEVLDPETREPVAEGEIGELVITALRRVHPLVRLATGDLSRVIAHDCPCGRPGPRLAGVLGRVGTGVKVRGMFVYPHQIEQLAADVPTVSRIVATVRQHNGRDELVFDVERRRAPATITPDAAANPGAAAGGSPDELTEQLANAAREHLRLRVDGIRVHDPGTLEDREILTDVRQG